MAKQSTQHKLDRVRPPGVHVTYDVEVGDAIELKELPFVMGVLGDFTGQPTEPLPRLRDPKFVEEYPDNFDSVLEGMKRGLGDFTGQPTEPLPRLRDRNFVEVNPHNFDSVYEVMKPPVSFSVETN